MFLMDLHAQSSFVLAEIHLFLVRFLIFVLLFIYTTAFPGGLCNATVGLFLSSLNIYSSCFSLNCLLSSPIYICPERYPHAGSCEVFGLSFDFGLPRLILFSCVCSSFWIIGVSGLVPFST
ncbi:hypothetical protein BJ508DRAFT_70800 [Ascobolus immersus RN42]|uniref:Uncharacterized protein n=1 Tax=Ascobolus immersus RN42 TaxID=1160509 RepID=A0A3N4IB53_ASCIM|nr:hypothetical protein BJ508DRAFT_70800 [Ascobolus immersus RN42]